MLASGPQPGGLGEAEMCRIPGEVSLNPALLGATLPGLRWEWTLGQQLEGPGFRADVQTV